METLFSVVKEASREVDSFGSTRTVADVFIKASSEMGELAEEVSVQGGKTYKQAGPDGVIGEAIDCIVTLIDLIHKEAPDMTEEEVIAYAKKKGAKWVDKTHADMLHKKTKKDANETV